MPAEYWPLLLVLLAVFGFIFSLARAMERRIVRLCRFLNGRLWTFFLAPLTWLYGCTLKKLFDLIHSRVEKTPLGQLDQKLSKVGGLKTLVFGIAAVLFVTIRLICVPDDLMELFYTLFFSTAVGSPFSFFMNGVSFSLATLIGAAFTRYLSLEAMRRSQNMSIFPRLVYGFVFLCAFGLLGTAMSDIFQSVSDFSINTFQWIFSSQGFPDAPEFVNWIFTGLLLLLLFIVCYLWLVLAIMTLKEYLSNLCFGIVPLTLLVIILSLLSALEWAGNTWVVVGVILTIGIWAEFHRHKLENLTEEDLENRMITGSKWNPFIKKKKMPKHTFFGDNQ